MGWDYSLHENEFVQKFSPCYGLSRIVDVHVGTKGVDDHSETPYSTGYVTHEGMVEQIQCMTMTDENGNSRTIWVH